MRKNIFNPCDKDITKDLPSSRSTIPCCQCSSTFGELGVGKRPHSASLRCGMCNRFVKWIGKAELGRIEAAKGVL